MKNKNIYGIIAFTAVLCWALWNYDVSLKLLDNFYKVIILSDHGNCDEMLNENNEIITTHSTSKVPFIITDENIELRKNGDLTNVAPTLLDYIDIAFPKEMTDAKSLIIKE